MPSSNGFVRSAWRRIPRKEIDWHMAETIRDKELAEQIRNLLQPIKLE